MAPTPVPSAGRNLSGAKAATFTLSPAGSVLTLLPSPRDEVAEQQEPHLWVLQVWSLEVADARKADPRLEVGLPTREGMGCPV